jgi:hypothetical protein
MSSLSPGSVSPLGTAPETMSRPSESTMCAWLVRSLWPEITVWSRPIGG